ncbi:cysteine desulfurase [Borreliella burgdorferi]|uniref:Probable cysteine desulfurase n=9 Tax=Borreliella burgdorferi TaxID=139 RepID=CSD_BORBU|nr:cysteine desulfurase [Borreliella burgdorferi]O51111.1 RecName: Full=Probable cysteine desulfurase [Borreliella burgdorferi B31]AGS66107.1 class V aminotransferase [Borreliella burgdorferi CA382]AAC66472.1 aminotransferase, class V superfamily [Borreliella burgdorferi B31]ACK74784.1 aminotransferase, class V superfamily protein [Borreliella burgdorferi ZS7]ADQ31205.1 aminotransferase, class V superfamily [Borreliella burgdorferi JD1]ARS29872.1 cysteine desulfurase [Borreliella burgdorferi]
MDFKQIKSNVEKVKFLRKDFPILNKKFDNKYIIYFDNAATSQKPKNVIYSNVEYYENYNANVHRSGHKFAIQSSIKIEKTRELVKNFINAESAKNIIFTSGTTDGINTIASSFFYSKYFKKKDEIILTTLEHNSNLLPWVNLANLANLKIKLAKFNEMGIITPEEIEKLITEKTKLISISGINNTLGTINDLESIGKIAKKYNICLFVDAAQMAPHIKIDVKKIGCDFLVFSGHKMLAPTGIGILYISNNMAEKLHSSKLGGNTVEEIFIENEKIKFKASDSPNKFESGTPNIAGIIGLEEAIKYIDNISMDFILEHDKQLIEYGVKKLQELDEVEFILNTNLKRNSIISFTVKNIHSHDIETYLDTMGIATRAGRTCSYVAFFPENLNKDHLLRISFYFYNTQEEIDNFILGLKKVIKELS